MNHLINRALRPRTLALFTLLAILLILATLLTGNRAHAQTPPKPLSKTEIQAKLNTLTQWVWVGDLPKVEDITVAYFEELRKQDGLDDPRPSIAFVFKDTNNYPWFFFSGFKKAKLKDGSGEKWVWYFEQIPWDGAVPKPKVLRQNPIGANICHMDMTDLEKFWPHSEFSSFLRLVFPNEAAAIGSTSYRDATPASYNIDCNSISPIPVSVTILAPPVKMRAVQITNPEGGYPNPTLLFSESYKLQINSVTEMWRIVEEAKVTGVKGPISNKDLVNLVGLADSGSATVYLTNNGAVATIQPGFGSKKRQIVTIDSKEIKVQTFDEDGKDQFFEKNFLPAFLGQWPKFEPVVRAYLTDQIASSKPN